MEILGYLVTGWLAGQHHVAFVLMASLYILNIKIQEQEEIPLLSVRGKVNSNCNKFWYSERSQSMHGTYPYQT